MVSGICIACKKEYAESETIYSIVTEKIGWIRKRDYLIIREKCPYCGIILFESKTRIKRKRLSRLRR